MWQPYIQPVINMDFTNKCTTAISRHANVFIYFMRTHLFVDAIVVLVRYVLSLSVCRAVWRVSLYWLERTVSWVHWPSAHQSISSFVALTCKMIPSSSSFPFPHAFITAWYVQDYHILLYY